MKSTNKFFFGWKRDLPDQRDRVYTAPTDLSLTAMVDLRPMFPSVYDQGNANSCVANAVGSIIEYDLGKQKVSCPYTPSRLYIYYNTRYAAGDVNYDSGASIRGTIKSLNVYGYCDEKWWPYNPSKYRVKPPKDVYAESLRHLVYQYSRVNQTANDLKLALASGHMVVFGFTVYQSFMSNIVASTGVVPMPSQEEYVSGGHAMCLVGFDDAKQWFICRNSWGPDWGDKGFCYMPYAYLLNPNLASDFWVIRSV